MSIIIDTTLLDAIGSLHPLYITLYLIKMIGWVPITIVILWGMFKMWVNFIQDEYAKKVKFVLLAIDVPKNNEQTPKAVEQIFAHLAGAHGEPNFIEKYWEGVFQLGFSFEIVSIDGYVQFLIYTPEVFRDLVEAAVYAQYPDAEIVEVEDYINGIPQKFPHPEYDLWGAELIPVAKDCYPIKTYPEFDDQIVGEMKDPMAALLEIMNRLRKGEQSWLQIVIKPIDQEWKSKCDKEVKKRIKEEVPVKKGPLDNLFDNFAGNLNALATSVGSIIVPGAVPSKPEKKEKTQINIVQNLTEGDKEIVASIQRKASKIGYECKIRMIYAGRKEVFSKQRGVSGVFGAIKQFNSNDRNALKPEKKRTITKVDYFMKKKREAERKTKIVKAYKSRGFQLGSAKVFILNIEELATLWHFPLATVKAPLVKKTNYKKAEPPLNLPVEGYSPFIRKIDSKKISPPASVPVIEETLLKEIEESKIKGQDDNLADDEVPSNLPFEK